MARTRLFGILIHIVLEIAMLGVKAYDCVTDQNLLHIVANIVFLSYVSAVLLVSLLWLPLLYFRPKYNDKVTWVRRIRIAEGVCLFALGTWSMIYGTVDNYIVSSFVLTVDGVYYIIAYPLKTPSCSKAPENSDPMIYYIPTGQQLRFRFTPAWEYTPDGRFGYNYYWRYVYE